MKKILIATNIFLLAVVCFMAGNQTKGNSGTIAFNQKRFQDTCQAKFCSGFNSGELSGQISYDLAVSMSKDYNRDNGKNFVCNGSQISSTEDASSVVFNLETLKKYIWYIEGNVCQRGCNRSDLQLGIRFYYAKYPNAKAMVTNSYLNTLDVKNYANKHTLFMVPVYRFAFSKGIYKNFNPLASRGCTFPWDRDTTLFAPVRIILGGDDMEEQNHGSLRPPPAGSGVFADN